MGVGETILGQITSVYGVKGWVKVYSYTEPLDNIFQYPNWTLVDGRASSRGERKVRLVTGKPHGKTLIAKLEGIEDRDQAAGLCGLDIRVETSELPALEEGEYYWYQLQGLRVRTADEGRDLGVVDHLIETGSNDVLVVRADAASTDGRERLIPFLPDEIIREVNLEGGILEADWDPEF
ncbi:ribosome maturation factor RimM [Halomonadaceae bacterium KBTZ08]